MRQRKKRMKLLALSIPAFFLIIMFLIVPLGNAVRVSLFKWNGYSQRMRFVGGRNYLDILTDTTFWISTVNTFVYGFGSTFLQNIAGLAVAIITLINSWQAMGFCMLIYLAGLQNIPAMYRESALLDGATKWQIFRKIEIPLLIPAITTAVITNLIGGLKLYDIIVTLTNGGPNRKSLSLSYYVSLLYFNDEKAGYSAAVGIALFVLIFLVTVPINHFLKSREVEY